MEREKGSKQKDRVAWKERKEVKRKDIKEDRDKGSKGKRTFEREKGSSIKMGNWKERNEAKRKLVRWKGRKEIKKYRTLEREKVKRKMEMWKARMEVKE